jgi:hypothetical protein
VYVKQTNQVSLSLEACIQRLFLFLEDLAFEDEESGNGAQDIKIAPVDFNAEHKVMLGHCKMILENDGEKLTINPDRFDKLITALRTAVDNYGTLDKESTPYYDIFDAFRLALKFYHFTLCVYFVSYSWSTL